MSIPPQIQLYLTPEHPCPYLGGRVARNLVADPEKVNSNLYARLLGHGFRRSGNYLYRPHCQHCNECQSLRIPVREFRPGRSLKRLQRLNRGLEWIAREPNTDVGTVDLYQRYLRSRHPDGGMDDATLESFTSFLITEWCPTRFFEIRNQDLLLGVAVTDDLGDSFSSVYTFFEPDQGARGLGNWAIMRQISDAASRSRAWLYLGYWIRECRKMTYKSRFRPHQRYVSGRWL